jgi:hypothetical protein
VNTLTRIIRSGWVWGVPAAVALAVSVAFLVAGLRVDVPECRTFSFEEAKERAVDLLDVAGWAGMFAVASCVLGVILSRGLRIRFIGGLIVSILVLAVAVYASFGVQVKCALD